MQAQSADGVIHDFPDGTDTSVVDRVMKQYAQSQAAPSKAYQSSVLPISKDEQGNLHLAVPEFLKQMGTDALMPGQVIQEAMTPKTQISDSDVSALTAGSALRNAAIVNPINREMAPMAPAPLTADAVKGAATSVYENPAVRATPVPARSVSDIGEEASKTFIKDHPQVDSIAGELRNIAPEKYLDETSVPVDTLDNISQRLGNISRETQMGRAGPEPTPKAAAASKLKSQVDGLISDASPEWSVADQNYGAFKTATAFDKRANKAAIRAEGSTGDYAARLKNVATQMLTNDRAIRGMTPEQIAQLKSISKGTATQNTLNWFGSVLGNNRMKYGVGGLIGGGVGMASGGPAAAVAGYVAGSAADTAAAKGMMGIRNALANRQTENFSQSILANSPYARSIPHITIPVDPKKVALARALLQIQQIRSRSPNLIPSYAGDNQQ